MSNYNLTQVTADLAVARGEAARRLAALREAEQDVRDARDDFERARKVVNRHSTRLSRLIIALDTRAKPV
jgi:hypothetical protein